MASPTGSSALILGATGATGRNVLAELLASPKYSKVIEVGRRVSSVEDLPGKEKLVQKTVNLETTSLEELSAKLREDNADVVIITLGTTRAKAGSLENWIKIDREIPLKAAQAAKRSDGKDQRLVYLSSTGANAGSYVAYLQGKGLTEQGLAKLGYKDTIMFRPGFLAEADRGEHRLVESLYGRLTNVLQRISPTFEIPVKTLAKSITIAGALGTQGLPATVEATTQPATAGVPAYTVIGNKGAINLASTS